MSTIRLKIFSAGATAVIALFAQDAIASGSATNAMVASVQVYSPTYGSSSAQLGLITLNKAISGTPACNTNGGVTRFSVDLTTAFGRQSYSNALLAMVSGRVIDAVGMGTCNLVSNAEDLWYLTNY